MICDHNTLKRKDTKLKKCGSVSGGKVSKAMPKKTHVRTHFPFKKPLSRDSVIAKIKDGSFLGYVQCDSVVSDELKSNFPNFPPIFKNTKKHRRNDIGDYMKNYAIENEMLKRPQRMLISSFKLEWEQL